MLLPELDVDDVAGSANEPAASPRRKRTSIRENVRKNTVVADTARVEIPARAAPTPHDPPQHQDEPFWDRKSVVFVSWYWPACILSGIAIGYLLFAP